MKNKLFIFIFLVVIFLSTLPIKANEFIFETNKIEIFDKGNRVVATKGNAKSKDNKISIDADNFIYKKIQSTLKASGSVLFKTSNGSILINAENIFYNEKLSLIEANTNVVAKDLSKGLILKSDQIFYNILDDRIYSDKKVEIYDKFKNIFISDDLIYQKKDGLLKITNVKISDFQKNTLNLERAFLNLNTNKLLAKDILIELENSFLDKDNDPRLKGKSLELDGNISKISKGVFTTCQKNDDCPPWQMSAKEIVHNKETQTISYKNAWLKLYDKPVFYFPKFFHPDPTVKRRSGFLIPTFSNSSTLGSSFNLPYYYAPSDNKDFTFSPRLYSNNKQLAQVEYRIVKEDSSAIIDTSFLHQKKDSSKKHFFSKFRKELDFNNFQSSNLSLDIQRVSGDTYLKSYKLKSPLIKEQNTLESTFNINAYRDDLSFDLDFRIYEDLSLKESDRYEFVLPNYTVMKKIESLDLNGDLSFNSMGYLKNHKTNVFENVMINDFIYDSSFEITNLGLKNNYKILLKNVNTDSRNSARYKQDTDSKLLSMMQYNTSLPLIKEDGLYKNILMPLASFKFSPNKSRKSDGDSHKIDINNVYSFNRIAQNDDIEEGESITYGIEYSQNNKKDDKKIFSTRIANNIRFNESSKLPKGNGIGNKTSDIMTGISLIPHEAFSLDYEFNLDENIEDISSETLKTSFGINNFITSFEYFNQNTSGKDSFLENKTSYIIDKGKELTFKTRENKETNITEFYNLMYSYENDCLIAAVEYNKDYYDDRDLKPEENIFFKLTIIPLGTSQSPNLFN